MESSGISTPCVICFVTQLRVTGADAKTMMELARHRDLATTMRYSHSDEGKKQEASKRLPELGL
jgi:site-specific recombinase XerD